MKPATIRLGPDEHEIALEMPHSFASRRAVVACGAAISESTADRVAGAALGMCWAHPSMKLRASYAASNYDVLAYGGDVIDDLGEKGWDLEDVCKAGVDCWMAIAKSLASPTSTPEAPRDTLEDVADQTDFTEAPKEAGTTLPA